MRVMILAVAVLIFVVIAVYTRDGETRRMGDAVRKLRGGRSSC